MGSRVGRWLHRKSVVWYDALRYRFPIRIRTRAIVRANGFMRKLVGSTISTPHQCVCACGYRALHGIRMVLLMPIHPRVYVPRRVSLFFAMFFRLSIHATAKTAALNPAGMREPGGGGPDRPRNETKHKLVSIRRAPVTSWSAKQCLLTVDSFKTCSVSDSRMLNLSSCFLWRR